MHPVLTTSEMTLVGKDRENVHEPDRICLICHHDGFAAGWRKMDKLIWFIPTFDFEFFSFCGGGSMLITPGDRWIYLDDSPEEAGGGRKHNEAY